MRIAAALALVLVIALQLPAGASPASPDVKAIAAAETAAYEKARPVFEKHCATCHSAKGKKAKKKTLRHFNIDRYPFGGHHAGEMGETIREVLGVTGEEPTMPRGKPGSVKGDELDAIVAWSHAFDRAHAAGVHGDKGHDHEHHH
jgi:mono/diheme cytochrome c family protein